MTNTPETCAALEHIAAVVAAMNTGYTMRIWQREDDDSSITFDIVRPRDTSVANFPCIFVSEGYDDGYSSDDEAIMLAIAPHDSYYGQLYSGVDLAVARRIVAGMNIAINVADALYALLDAAGFPVRRP